MKIHRWIDKYNYRVSFRIIKKYNNKITNGASTLYALHPSFWGAYLIRILLVIFSILFLKKTAYRSFSNLLSNNYSPFFSPDKNAVIYIKLREFISTLFGYRYFVTDGTLPILDRKTILSRHLSFKTSQSPVLSIVVSEINRLDYLYNCLKSLQDNLSEKYAYEIIVITENLDFNIRSFLNNNVKGVVLHDTTLTASIAKAELIVLLSSDSQIKINSLEFLVKTLMNKDIDCAVAKLISKNGLLPAAGNEGTFENPNHPDFNYQKVVKIKSFKNLIIRKKHFFRLGSGKDTIAIYQPLSEIIYFNDELTQECKTPDTPFIREVAQKTILFIDDVIPMPDQDSGSNRIFRIMQLIKALGYHVIFLPANGEKKAHYFEQMTLEGFEVLYRFPNRQGMIKILMDRLPGIDLAWICKPHNNVQFRFLFEKKKDLRWIYDTIDLHFLRLQREGELLKNDELLQAATAIKKTELEIAKHADVTIAITNDEQIILQNEQVNDTVVIPNIHEIKARLDSADSFHERNGLLFIGSYLHNPNVDAANWLVKEIMPIIWGAGPVNRSDITRKSPNFRSSRITK